MTKANTNTPSSSTTGKTSILKTPPASRKSKVKRKKGATSTIKTRLQPSKPSNSRFHDDSLRMDNTNPIKETIDMTKMTDDLSSPAADSAKKRRIFSLDRSMEEAHSPSKLITLDNQKGEGKRKEPNQQKEIDLT
eukprot:3752996-Ditylum_brightwellii.AAC.1